jgi:DNA-binding response OmpR family regulator
MNTQLHTLLIAEDDSGFLKILQQMFEEKNFKTYTADNGILALEQYHTYKPEVILMDIDMPEKDGWEVLNQIRKENTLVPIIVMTGHKIEEKDSLKSYDLGATFFIRKPFHYKEIAALINSQAKSICNREDIFSFGKFRLNMSSSVLQANSEHYHLTEREAKILGLLVKNSNIAVETRDILNYIWHNNELQNNHQMLRNTVSKLNKLFKKHKTIHIESAYGKGYIMRISPSQ